MYFLRCGPQLKIRTNKTGLIFQGNPCMPNFSNSNSVLASQDYSCTTNNACATYEFMLLNVVRLLLSMSKDKSKIKFISDLCSNNTLFVALCETFLSDVISDSEIYISNFYIIRCDRHSRIADFLLIKFIQPELIVILLYRHTSCSGP